jgi:steroid Delta-isomerase
MTSPLPKITAWFESLTPQTLDAIGEVYAGDAHFKDPFNDVVGIDQIRAIYAHMFENLTNPRFEITQVIVQAEPLGQTAVQASFHAFVAWRFKFEWRGQSFDIPGGTRFAINDQGLVTDHVDYWDVAAGLYERLPLIGAVLKRLRKRMAAV